MKKRRKLLAVILTIIVATGMMFNVFAVGNTVEYDCFDDVLESIQSEAGVSLYLYAVEKVGDMYQAEYSATQQISPAYQQIAPAFIATTPKTIEITYSTFSSIPEDVFYEEFHSGFNTWMSGTLYLRKAEQMASGWKATFSGTIKGHI